MKSLTSKVALNTLVQTVGKVMVVATSVTTISLLTRYLGEEGFGEYTTTMTYLGFFGIVVDLGMYLIVVRELARDKKEGEKYLNNAFGLRLILGLLILALAPLLAYLVFPYSSVVDLAIAIGAVSFWFINLNQIVVSLFQVNLHMWKLVVGEVLGRLAILGLTYFFVLQNGDLLSFIWANVVGNVVLFGVSYLFAVRYIKLVPKFDWKIWKVILVETLPLAVVVLLNRIYFNIDTIFLSVFKSQEEVGIYGLPYKVLDILISFPSIFAGLVFPTLAKHGLGKLSELRRVYQKSFDFMMLTSLPMLVGLVMLADPIIRLLGGKEGFSDSVLILQILSVAVLFVFFSTLSNNLVIAVKMQKKLMTISLVSVVINLALNIWLIPKYSYWAASSITVLTEFIVMIMSGVFVWGYVKVLPNLKMTMKVVPSVVIMGLVLYWLSSWNLFLLVIVGGAIYVMMMFFLGGISREMIMNVIGKDSKKITN
ncbi:flippase [Patescibacteria group bacterium]|nr:flippase [Patescibacteria group bacterium]